MLYFKHSELVNDYHVSLKTVHNWIDAAKQGKLDLQLHEQNNKTYIANTPSNLIVLDTLVDKGKKYRNTLHHKVIKPTPDFYKQYSRRQILDIISNLTTNHEIPLQYNYIGNGATNWSNWTNRIIEEDTPGILGGTIELVSSNLDHIEKLLRNYEKVNVIDVGVGNALPSKNLVGHLLKIGKLNRYIAIDISQSMLDIAEQNIKTWFAGKVRFEGHIRDIMYERFDDLIVDDMLGNKGGRTINLVLVLGSTPANLRFPIDALRIIHSSMSSDDLLLYTRKPDTKAARRYFNFSTEKGATTTLSPLYGLTLKLLGIDDSLYDAEMGFDDDARMRYVRVRLKTALTIHFTFDDGGEREVKFEKGDVILVFRVWHQTLLELISQFDEVGFSLLQSSLTQDREYLLTISGVDKDSA